MKKILHLTLKKKWFDLIKSGKKTVEYREIKPYWTKRLMVFGTFDLTYIKVFDEIHFRNGYKKDSPFMRVEWKAMGKSTFEGLICYAINLGKILEVKNHE